MFKSNLSLFIGCGSYFDLRRDFGFVDKPVRLNGTNKRGSTLRCNSCFACATDAGANREHERSKVHDAARRSDDFAASGSVHFNAPVRLKLRGVPIEPSHNNDTTPVPPTTSSMADHEGVKLLL